jgi:heptaprenylglyceryl phosphate synthase
LGESYDDLVIAVELRWIDIRSKLEGAPSAEVFDFILAELERDDLRLQILERKIEKITDFIKIFGKDDIKATRNLRKILKKVKVIPTLPIKKEFQRGEEWVHQEKR